MSFHSWIIIFVYTQNYWQKPNTFQNNNLPVLHKHVLKDILTDESVTNAHPLCSLRTTQKAHCVITHWGEGAHSGPVMKIQIKALYQMITVFITITLNTWPKLQVRVSESGKHTHYSHTDDTGLKYHPKCPSFQTAMNSDSSSLH